jgi:hypothetical protein
MAPGPDIILITSGYQLRLQGTPSFLEATKACLVQPLEEPFAPRRLVPIGK